jgi:hypothetical protein
MPNFTVQLGPVVVLANTTVPNLLTGNRFERCPYPIGQGKLLCAGSAAGLTVELNIGGRSITPVCNVNIQNRIPIEPDDTIAKDFTANAGELQQITVVNTTAGNLNFFFRLEMDEMEYAAA